MKYLTYITNLGISSFLASSALADQTTAPSEDAPVVTQEEKATEEIEEKNESEPKKKASKEDKLKTQKDLLALENSLHSEETRRETRELRAQVALLKLQKEQLAEEYAIFELEQKKAQLERDKAFKEATADLREEASQAKLSAEKATNLLKAQQAENTLALTELESEMKTFELEKRRNNYAEIEPVYLAEPLSEDGTLIISDRRIDLNGPISYGTANYILDRINYYNNKNTEHPIFIVIDSSPGGSVMAGMNILKAMHGSEAPVYVVVRTFAASMAAGITTLAEHSYALPDAVILHHQVLSSSYGNLSETREHTADMEEWWRRLADPIAEKMGITRAEFIEQMYENTVTGDWTEFADNAQKLKWVDQVVTNVRETALLKNPDAKPTSSTKPGETRSQDAVDSEVNRTIPRLNPKDLLYLYNPDRYYQIEH